ncbi:hypothetical protein [Serratia symbiotica]|nr:hypothetical protein [Serratia symbiotica]
MITVITTSSKWLWWCGELAVALVLAVSYIQPTTPQNHLVLVSYTGRRIPVIFKERLKQSRLVNPLWFNAWFTSPPQAAVVSWKLSHNQEGNICMSFKDIVESHTIDLKTLLDQLEGYPSDIRVSFSGLDFKRVKQRGQNMLQIEFNQSVYRTDEDLLVVQDHSR